MKLGTENFFINPVNEWSQLRGGFNWYTFTFLELQFEHDKFTGGLELWFMFFGLGFYIRWNYNPKILEDMAKEPMEDSMTLEEFKKELDK